MGISTHYEKKNIKKWARQIKQIQLDCGVSLFLEDYIVRHYSYLFFIDTNLGSTLRASAFTHVHLIAPQAEQNVRYYCSYQLQVGLNHKRNHWSKRALNPCLFAVCSWMKGNVRPLCPGSYWAVTRLEPTMVGWLGFLFIYFNIMVTVVDIILVLDYYYYYYYLGIY